MWSWWKTTGGRRRCCGRCCRHSGSTARGVFDLADAAFEAMSDQPPHVLLTDWQMEPMSGYRLVQEIRKFDRRPLSLVPIIMITAHATPSLIVEAFRVGINQMLVKPVAPGILLRKIRAVTLDNTPFVAVGDRFVVDGMDRHLRERQSSGEFQEFMATSLRNAPPPTTARKWRRRLRTESPPWSSQPSASTSKNPSTRRSAK